MVQVTPPTAPEWRDIPIIDGYVAKIGRIKAIYATQCDGPDAYIAVLAMWHSFPYMVWSLFGPDCIDLVDERRGRPHRRRRKIRWRGATLLNGFPNMPGWGWRIFRIGDLAQRVSWYFGLIDATSDFIINWMTLPFIWNGCHIPGAPQAHAEATVEPWSIPTNLDWDGFTLAPMSQHIFTIGGSACNITEGYDWASAVSATFRRHTSFPPPSSIELRVRIENTDTVVWSGSTSGGGDGPWEIAGIYGHHGIINPAMTIRLEIKNDEPVDAFGSRWDVSGVYLGEGIGPAGCGNIREELV